MIVASTEVSAAALAARAKSERGARASNRWTTWLARTAAIAIAADIVLLAALFGVRLRQQVWQITAPLHFVSDIHRGFDWGRTAAVEGYLNQYEKMQPQHPEDANWLDYAPLRLATVTLWGRWAIKHYPDVTAWEQHPEYAFTAPMLRFNMLMEALGVGCAFLLTRLWVIRSTQRSDDKRLPTANRSRRPFFAGCIAGLFAALLLWFNPGIIVSAYGWPTWDMWVVPMFLLAALLAASDRWFSAGVALGVGAMFKGQQFTVAPIFLLWALMLGRFAGALRFVVGAVAAFALIASPWLLSYVPSDLLASARQAQLANGQQAWQAPIGLFNLPRVLDWPAISWVAGVVVVAIVFPIGARHRRITKNKHQRTIALAVLAILACVAVIWPWLLARNRPHLVTGLVCSIAVATLVVVVRPRTVPVVAAGAAGTALLLCMDLFHGSHAWWDCGFHYGTVHWPWMITGFTDNLPGILKIHYGWTDPSMIAATVPDHLMLGRWPAEPMDITIGQLLVGIYIITLLLSGIGVGAHARRRDRRLLVALVAPWLMFFCFPPQIHERYLLFAAGAACLCAGVSVGMTLLGVFLSLVTFIMTLHCMMIGAAEHDPANIDRFGQELSQRFPHLFSADGGGKVFDFLQGTHPDLAWAVLLCAGIFLYYSLAPTRRVRSVLATTRIPPLTTGVPSVRGS
jgi:hypothetical protein